MKDVYGKQQLIIHVIGLILALALGSFGLDYALGFGLGMLASVISLVLLEKRIDVILGERIKGLRTYLNFMVGNLFLLVPLALAVVFPVYFNLLGVGLGVLYLRYAMFVRAFLVKGKDR